MHASTATPGMEPQELAFLKGIFNEVLQKRGLNNDTSAATTVAAQIIELYQTGIRDPQELSQRISI